MLNPSLKVKGRGLESTILVATFMALQLGQFQIEGMRMRQSLWNMTERLLDTVRKVI
jgi:hypothetical protein